jgi:hypothetical protein
MMGRLRPAKLWKIMPCYSYVMYRPRICLRCGPLPRHWRQEGLLLGTRVTFGGCEGPGQVLDWNVCRTEAPGRAGYPSMRMRSSTWMVRDAVRGFQGIKFVRFS